MVRLSDEESKREVDATIQQRAEEEAKRKAELEALFLRYRDPDSGQRALNESLSAVSDRETELVS
jgi:hypothetical protein